MRTRDKQRIVKMFLRGKSVWDIVEASWSFPPLMLGPSHVEEVIREHMRSTIGPRGGKKR